MQILQHYFTKDRLRRLGAFAVDAVVFILLLYFFMAALGRPDFIGAQEQLQNLQTSQTQEELEQRAAQALESFNTAMLEATGIWLGYEVLCQLLTNGRTVGKKLFGLRIVSAREGEGRFRTALRMVVRSVLRVVFVFLLRGIPMVVALAYLFKDDSNRTGYDRLSKTRVVVCK